MPRVSHRKHLAQIFRHEYLSNEEKVLGAAIWRRVNRKLGYTVAAISTLAREVGIKPASAEALLDHLVKLGVFQTDLGRIRPLPIFDGHLPKMAYGDHEFERAARIWLNHVITDRSLTIAQRVAAYGFLA